MITSYKFFLLALIAVPIMTSSILTGCSTTPGKESTGQYLDSSVITTKVKAKLLSDKSIKSLPVTVKTYKNIVQLSGFVDSNYQKLRIVQLAYRVEGVQQVQDFLVVKTH